LVLLAQLLKFYLLLEEIQIIRLSSSYFGAIGVWRIFRHSFSWLFLFFKEVAFWFGEGGVRIYLFYSSIWLSASCFILCGSSLDYYKLKE